MNLFHQLMFLVLLHELLYFVSCIHNHNLNCKENEKNALLKFKQNLTDPSKRLSSWEGDDCCSWAGIRCNNETGNVIDLDLRKTFTRSGTFGDEEGRELSGKIDDSSLLELKFLRHLDLSMNNFHGTIPQSLGNLTYLEHLDLSFNNLESGDLWIASLSSLKYLNLGGIDLSTTSSQWLETISALPSLLELHLPQCQLSKFPPYLENINFTSLLVLNLSKNNANSTIPKWLFNLTSLKTIDLSSNSLYGFIPEEFSGLTSVQNLDLSSNYGIEGRLPNGLGKLCELKTLSLASNNLNGQITEFVDTLSKCKYSRLESLNLGYNYKLNGDLPESLGHLKNLKYVYLWYNSFTGSIPSTIGNLSKLQELSLSNNKMSGNIPPSFGQLSSLVVMDLYDNSWEGVITEEHLENLSSLREISIGRFSPNVSLVFNISSEWTPPFKLQFVKIQGCRLGPGFPTWLRNQSDLQTLVINYANISGVIPQWFLEMDLQLQVFDVAYNQLTGKAPDSLKFLYNANVDLSSNSFRGPFPLWSSNLSTLYLRDNKFFGPIPHNIGTSMPLFSDFDISQNNLNGTIPSSLGNLTELTTLIISNNWLHGEIPGFWANMPMLYILDMSNNSLCGSIPDSIGFLANLRFFVLSSNNISGPLPSSLKNCTQLASLDLGDNNLSGSLPTWIGVNLLSLLILCLRNNSFTGNIPPQICNITVLHILDVSNNNLSGAIPSCIGNLSGFKTESTSQDTQPYEGSLQVVSKGSILKYKNTLYLVNSIDMSRNNLSGEIPREITSLIRLATLNLSMNGLTGIIPADINKVKMIETLDLSQNRLSGPIPSSMASLTFLTHLNLSYNNLSGQIPSGNQFQTLTDPSIYEGNIFLCGIPLSVECEKPEMGRDPNDDEGDVDENDRLEKLWFFVIVGCGYLLGFWGVYGSLIIKKEWSDACFDFFARMMIMITGFVSGLLVRHRIDRRSRRNIH